MIADTSEIDDLIDALQRIKSDLKVTGERLTLLGSKGEPKSESSPATDSDWTKSAETSYGAEEDVPF